MKLAKSLLLGSAAGLAAVAGAQAADLPVRKAAPAVAVDYVRVCSTYGSGYFVVPGTEGCLRISGRVRVDTLFRKRFDDFEDRFGVHVRGRIQLEHRQATSFGLLRTVIRAEIRRNTGSPATDSVVTRRGAHDARIQQAYIQFGGLTAGRVTSFFSNPDLPTGHMGTLRFDDAPDIALLAYTFDFGGGFSATLSLEDPQDRRVFGAPLAPFPLGFGVGTVPIGGTDWPDVVANLKWKGTWGNFQIAGALHDITDAGAFGREDNHEFGWAVRVDGSINLPTWGPSTALWAAATYANGALAYVSGDAAAAGVGTGIFFGGVGGLPIADAIIDVNGDLDRTTGWSIAGGLRHAFSPQWRTNIFGSYMRVNYGDDASTVIEGGVFDGARVGFVDFTEWRIGANVFYTPVAGLDFGLEVLYANIDPRGSVVTQRLAGPDEVAVARVRGSEHVWEGRFRVQRDF